MTRTGCRVLEMIGIDEDNDGSSGGGGGGDGGDGLVVGEMRIRRHGRGGDESGNDAERGAYHEQDDADESSARQRHDVAVDHADAKEAIERNCGHEKRAHWHARGHEEKVGLAEQLIVGFEVDALHEYGGGHEHRAHGQIDERQEENKKRRRLFVELFPVYERYYQIADRAHYGDACEERVYVVMMIA